MRLRTHCHDFELPTIKYEFNKRSFIVRLLFINYVLLCVLLPFVLSSFLLHCTHVQMSLCIKLLLTYLLTYSLTHVTYISLITGPDTMIS